VSSLEVETKFLGPQWTPLETESGEQARKFEFCDHPLLQALTKRFTRAYPRSKTQVSTYRFRGVRSSLLLYLLSLSVLIQEEI
jgi:hypothetical protein